MNPPSMVVLIILIVMIANVIKARAKFQAQGRSLAAADSGEAARLRGEVQQLKERVQVLERCITDNHSSTDLDRQIESLRDR